MWIAVYRNVKLFKKELSRWKIFMPENINKKIVCYIKKFKNSDFQTQLDLKERENYLFVGYINIFLNHTKVQHYLVFMRNDKSTYFSHSRSECLTLCEFLYKKNKYSINQ